MNSAKGEIYFLSGLQLLFITLKLIKIINWPWVWILFPIWIAIIIAFIILIAYVLIND